MDHQPEPVGLTVMVKVSDGNISTASKLGVTVIVAVIGEAICIDSSRDKCYTTPAVPKPISKSDDQP